MAENWKVTSQKETTTMQNGVFTPAMSITFQTTHGTYGTVVLPLSTYTAENVKHAIDERVAQIDAVFGL